MARKPASNDNENTDNENTDNDNTPVVREEPAFDDIENNEPMLEREIAAAFFEANGFIPQAVGEDATDTMATPTSAYVFWNHGPVLQAVYRRKRPGDPIHLLPGDCVVGREFRRFHKMNGGPLSDTRPDPKTVMVKSKRDCAYFEARGMMEGKIADVVKKYQRAHTDVIKSRSE